MDLLTNDTNFAASTIALLYKDRWRIECFFKMIKQLLKVKGFYGRTENALRTQLWVALIALLLTKWLHALSGSGMSFTEFFIALSVSLFLCEDIRSWLEKLRSGGGSRPTTRTPYIIAI
jgi:IS4 transposase